MTDEHDEESVERASGLSDLTEHLKYVRAGRPHRDHVRCDVDPLSEIGDILGRNPVALDQGRVDL
ncbi:MAG: hypothetical protein ACPHQP_03700 [Longimicrobiales bacterium]